MLYGRVKGKRWHRTGRRRLAAASEWLNAAVIYRTASPFIASFRSRRLYVTAVGGNILYNVLIIVFHKLSRACHNPSLAASPPSAGKQPLMMSPRVLMLYYCKKNKNGSLDCLSLLRSWLSFKASLLNLHATVFTALLPGAKPVFQLAGLCFHFTDNVKKIKTRNYKKAPLKMKLTIT